MNGLPRTSSVLERWIICVMDALLVACLVAWVANCPYFQIFYILAAFAIGLLAVLSVTAWKQGFRWFFTRKALRFYAWVIVGIISVIVAFYAEEFWRGRRAWAALQREAAARGESLDLSSVFPPPVADAANFALAPGMERILGSRATSAASGGELPSETFYHGTSDKWPAASWALQKPIDLKAWQQFVRRHPLTNSADADSAVSRLAFPMAPEPQTPAADVLLALSRYDEGLNLLRAATQRPKARYPLAYENGFFALDPPSRSARLDSLYHAAHILSLRAVAELHQGQSGQALEDTLLALRLSDSFAQQPFEQLHRLRAAMLVFALQPVWEGLVLHRWSEAQLQTLQQRLGEADLVGEYRVEARGQALVLMNLADQAQAFLQGRRSAWGELLKGTEGSHLFWVWAFRCLYPAGWFYQDKVWMYRFYENRADVQKALASEDERRWGKEVLSVTDPLLLVFVAPRLRQSFEDALPRALFLQTACQEAVAACALERYRIAKGEYPDSLEALVPEWLKQVPPDLLDPKGSSLKYFRESGGGFLLYSIGLNRVDDHGKPGSPDESWHVRDLHLPRLREGDWVWAQPGRTESGTTGSKPKYP
jgi:hypothetical protein